MAEFLTISGSLRSASTNTAALDAFALLAPTGVSIVAYRGLAALPAFNPDLEGERLPDSVRELRALVARIDALVISSPEYARGIAGSLKNLLDWLVGGAEFPGKLVALISTSSRAEHSPAQLRLIIGTMSGLVIEPACVTLPLLGRALTANQIIADRALAQALRTASNALAEAVQARKHDAR
ncbi:MAG: NADPH-dependent FMN reductase [Stellaceae bacterium]